jgi:hypothetical protein
MKCLRALAFYFALFFAERISCADTFRVVTFATAEQDLGHLSFVREANRWFPAIASQYGFTYEYTTNWNNLNENYLRNVTVVIFLDTRPENPVHRSAFENYMNNGGAWIGFHFSGFALDNSAYPQNWDWYHNTFLGAGQYAANTWRPTRAILKTENMTHPATSRLPIIFQSAANEWYRWTNDLTKNPDINILISIDEASFPLGTENPWLSGYYPVVWANRNYKMIYLNMGHNDIDYENGNVDLSQTFEFEIPNRIVIDALLWFGNATKNKDNVEIE